MVAALGRKQQRVGSGKRGARVLHIGGAHFVTIRDNTLRSYALLRVCILCLLRTFKQLIDTYIN